jgi:MFS superfamily sulfate permease-like transporter
LRTELLARLIVALVLVPEAVAYAFVAGVHPMVGPYAAFIVGLISALTDGRPGMISGAAGALALVMVLLVARFTKVIPARLAGIGLVAAIVLIFGLDVPRVGTWPRSRAGKYLAAGKRLQLRHLTRDCHRMLNKAGHLMDDSDDDPDYGLSVDDDVTTGVLGGGH